MQHNPLFLETFIIIFPIFWCVILFLLHKLSGWDILMQKFYYKNSFFNLGLVKNKFGMASGSVGIYGNKLQNVAYRNCLKLEVCENGFKLGLLFPFALFSKTIIIPYEEIEVIDTNTSLHIFKKTILKLKNLPIRFVFWGKPGEILLNNFNCK